MPARNRSWYLKQLGDRMDTSNSASPLEQLEGSLEFARRQIRKVVEQHRENLPAYTTNGQWVTDGHAASTSGLAAWAGMLWLFAERDPDSDWQKLAIEYSQRIEFRAEQNELMNPGLAYFLGSHGPWARILKRQGKNAEAPEQMLERAADTFVQRFQRDGRYLCTAQGPEFLSITTLLDLPLLLHVAEQTDNEWYREVAALHCATTRRHLIRGDGSVNEEAVFEVGTGHCTRYIARRGYRNDSCWAQGLACATLGFALSGQLVNFAPWLETARQCAHFLIEKTSGQAVPPWDFDAPDESAHITDTTAAAMASAALFTLADADQTIGSEQARQRRYLQEIALRSVETLCDPEHLAVADPDWQGILKGGVYDYPAGLGVHESLAWGDFFFVESLCRAIDQLRSRQHQRDTR
jgi:unsaturated chondroitin disaccharide hydrolase